MLYWWFSIASKWKGGPNYSESHIAPKMMWPTRFHDGITSFFHSKFGFVFTQLIHFSLHQNKKNKITSIIYLSTSSTANQFSPFHRQPLILVHFLRRWHQNKPHTHYQILVKFQKYFKDTKKDKTPSIPQQFNARYKTSSFIDQQQHRQIQTIRRKCAVICGVYGFLLSSIY